MIKSIDEIFAPYSGRDQRHMLQLLNAFEQNTITLETAKKYLLAKMPVPPETRALKSKKTERFTCPSCGQQNVYVCRLSGIYHCPSCKWSNPKKPAEESK